jgi:murein DD-endopeptidase MepM/ murein hydrolase activator NlpD
VDEILALARLYGQDGVEIPFTYDRLQVQLQTAERALARRSRVLVRATLAERRFARAVRVADARAEAAPLLSERLALQKRAFQADARRAGAASRVASAKRKLRAAEKTLAEARSSSWTSSFAPAGSTLLAAPLYQGDYVFPVGGGPSAISVGHYHHDYPAADIAAPEGAPLYALTDGFVVDAWALPSGSCGIGLTLRAAGDGREWTYCHMSYLEPAIRAGVAVAGGQPVGLVGSTGHSTGPHLHLQLRPASSYPQLEPWFEAFAGSAFRWQDAPTAVVGPVFAIVDGASEPRSSDPGVIMFTVDRP